METTYCPRRTALQISLALYGSAKSIERIPRIREYSPRETVEIVPIPAELSNVRAIVPAFATEVL